MALSSILLLTWDGGGNVPVTVAIAEALKARGDDVTVAGPRSLQHVVTPGALHYAELGSSPPLDPRRRLAYLMDVAQGTDALLRRFRTLAERADAVVIDCNLSWALQSSVPGKTAALVHTALGLYLPVWQTVLNRANDQRAVRGLEPLARAADVWAKQDLLLVASFAQFDRPGAAASLRPLYIGPVSPGRSDGGGPHALPPAGRRPRVLISYSTDALQNSPDRLQTALDALADLPVAVLATTSGLFAAARLRIPPNATVFDYVAHDDVLPEAALIVCHAGHGTTMAALHHGVPLVCVPGLGRDQEPIARRVHELGFGIALERDAGAASIRAAAAAILADPGYRARVRDFASHAGPVDGAHRASEAVATLLGRAS